MLELSQLDLQFTLMSSGSLREDIQNQASAIQHTAFKEFFEVALLTRTQGMVEDDHVALPFLYRCADLLQLAAADVEAGIGNAPGTLDNGHRVGTGRTHQFNELLEFILIGMASRRHLHKDGIFTCLRTLEHVSDAATEKLSKRKTGRDRPEGWHRPVLLTGNGCRG